MSFNPSNVTRAWSWRPGTPGAYLHQGNVSVPEVWDYDAGSDTIADIESSGSPYFSSDLLFRPGDLIRATAEDGKVLYRVENVKCSAAGRVMQVQKLCVVSTWGGDYAPLAVGP